MGSLPVGAAGRRPEIEHEAPPEGS